MDNYDKDVKESVSFDMDQNDISIFNKKKINYTKKRMSMPTGLADKYRVS